MIRGTKRALVSEPDTGTLNKNKIDLALMARIHNRWDVEVIDAATGEVKQRARGFNVICNYWWSVVPNGSNGPSYIQYGSGSGTPAATDTALFSRIGVKNFSSSSLDESTLSQGFIAWKYAIQLAPADAVGETITEVGLSANQSSGLLTHAMLQDMNGNPISITKTATDIVNIYATVFLHLTADRYANGKIRITKNVSWMRGFSYNSSYMGVRIMQTAWGYTGFGTSQAASTYNASQKKYTLNFSQFPAGSGNLNGGALWLAYGMATSAWTSDNYAWLFLLPATKSQILSEAIGTGDGSTQNFKTKFAFPSDATVYVDGVAQTSGVTVVADHPTEYERLDHFLEPIVTVTTPDKLVIFEDTLHNYSAKQLNAGEEQMYENMVEGLAITSLKIGDASAAGSATIYVSDDLETWTDVGATLSSDWWEIPAQYAAAKYWKIRKNSSGIAYLNGGKNADLTSYAIRFDTAPANGAVITADYKTPMIPKDDNHLMDVSMTVTFGEYTGEEI